tara:strand:+ start:460 stop:783 length:324 start_codon:yes stop_codon:yes gene_type:complete
MAKDAKKVAAVRKARKDKKSLLALTGSKITPPKPPKTYKGKPIELAVNVFKFANKIRLPNEHILKVPFFIDMMEKLRAQGYSEREAYSAAVSSHEWDSYSHVGDRDD